MRALSDSRTDFVLWACLIWLTGLALAAALVPFVGLAEHEAASLTLSEPRFARPGEVAGHPLGTNNFGLDLLSRSLYGARLSLIIAVSAVALGSVVGLAIGVAAGYLRGPADRLVGIVTNSLLAIPPLILLIAMSTILEPTPRNMALVLGLLTAPSMIRVARANTIAFAQREFVTTARLIGVSRLRVMIRELVPNVAMPLMSMAVVLVSAIIVAEASLSFLGLGVQPPRPTWGNMIAEGEGGVMESHPHIVLIPGTFLLLTVLSFNLLGERAQRKWDPRKAAL